MLTDELTIEVHVPATTLSIYCLFVDELWTSLLLTGPVLEKVDLVASLNSNDAILKSCIRNYIYQD